MKNFAIALMASAATATNLATEDAHWTPNPTTHDHFRKFIEQEKIPKGTVEFYRWGVEYVNKDNDITAYTSKKVYNSTTVDKIVDYESEVSEE